MPSSLQLSQAEARIQDMSSDCMAGHTSLRIKSGAGTQTKETDNQPGGENITMGADAGVRIGEPNAATAGAGCGT